MYADCGCGCGGQCQEGPQLGSWGPGQAGRPLTFSPSMDTTWFSPRQEGAPQRHDAAGWGRRALEWGVDLLPAVLPACRDPWTDPEVTQPCPGEIPPREVEQLWASSPLPARAELWARTVVNNPQWRCAPAVTVLRDRRTGWAVQRAAMGGRDCRMSRDRASLAPTWRRFVQQGGRDGGWVEHHILQPIGAGAVQAALPWLIGGGIALVLLVRR